MGLLVDGEWVDKWYKQDSEGRFVRPETSYRQWVKADGSTDFAPEADRYHLFVSLACPWAHRTLIARALRGLEDAISVTVVDPHMGEHGWEITGEGRFADPIIGAKYLHQIYTTADPEYTGRVTVPVLWDKKTETIVNNESRQILRMMTTEFSSVGEASEPLYYEDLHDDIESTMDEIYEPINNGVYRAGFASSQSAYESAVADVFAALDHWNEVLGSRRFLCGDRLTEADVCMFTTLVRFDPVYVGHFKCNVKRIEDYEHLYGFMRDIYQVAGVAETVDFNHIKEHYYWSHPTINPKRIVPVGPEIDLEGEHGRQNL